MDNKEQPCRMYRRVITYKFQGKGETSKGLECSEVRCGSIVELMRTWLYIGLNGKF